MRSRTTNYDRLSTFVAKVKMGLKSGRRIVRTDERQGLYSEEEQLRKGNQNVRRRGSSVKERGKWI